MRLETYKIRVTLHACYRPLLACTRVQANQSAAFPTGLPKRRQVLALAHFYLSLLHHHNTPHPNTSQSA